MAVDVPLRCACGEVTGSARGASPSTGKRLVCYCDDCQSFAHWLGRADEVLDEHGGTDVFQFTPARITFGTGQQHIQCMRLSPKGTMRWYAACCNTPICNAVSHPGVPFASLIQPFMRHDAARDEEVGPVKARLSAAHAHGTPPTNAHDSVPWTVLASAAWSLTKARLQGEHRPSPFFVDGAPRVKPIVVSLEERKRLRDLVRPAS